MKKNLKTAPEILCIDAEFIDGVFYNRETKQPIEFLNHSISKILILSDCLKNVEVSDLGLPKNSEAKIQELLNVHNMVQYCCALKQGDHLFFEIKDTVFKIELLEDLYFYKRANSIESRQFTIFNCQCKVLDVEKNIIANSLSEIYRQTYVKYWYNDGANSVNAFDRFFTTKEVNNKYNSIRAILDGIKWG